jgi:hypothetical protein
MTQRALDVCCSRGIGDLSLVSAVDEHIVVWAGATGHVLRVVSTTDLGVRVSASASAVVTNAAGAIVPQPAPVGDWHPSMRYYRQSQLADDVFASTRNLWLAVENLLDSLSPVTPGEREERWLKKALRAADARVGLANFLPGGQSAAPHNAAYQYFYADARTHLFHSKASRHPLLPHEEQGTNLLAGRHEYLTRFYLALLESMTGMRRPSGLMTFSGFEQANRVLEVTPEFVVTDDPGPLDATARVVNPEGGLAIHIGAARDNNLERPGLKVFVGATSAERLAALERVSKVGFICQSLLFAVDAVHGRLLSRDVATFEAQMAFRLKNLSMPKYFTEM